MNIISTKSPKQIREMYAKLNNERFVKNMFPICVQCYSGAVKYPTKNGYYIIRTEYDNVGNITVETVLKVLSLDKIRKLKLKTIL